MGDSVSKTTKKTEVYAEYLSPMFEKWMPITTLGETTTKAFAKQQIKEHCRAYHQTTKTRKFRIVTVTTIESIEEIK